MGDRHKHGPISFRPTEGDRAWLHDYAAETGRPVRAVLKEALAEYRLHRSVNGKIVIHKDGDPRNNNPANLEIREAPEEKQ
jgi:hypothetical protein